MMPNRNHLEGARLREQGESEKALETYQRARSEYEQKEDWEGLVRVLLEEAIVYLHQLEEQDRSELLSSALVSLRQAGSVIEAKQLPSDLELLWAVGTGNALSRAGEWPTATNYYQRAVALEKPSEHKANLQAHAAYAQAKAGDTAAMRQLDRAIEELKNPDFLVSPETHRTWLSGALLKKAELMQHENPQAAQAALAEAFEVISAEPILSVRLKQLQRLQKQFTA